MKSQHKVLLVISGSIAAIKSLDVIRLLKKKKVDVTCVLTGGGAHFVTPMACAALSGNQVYTDLFDLKNESEMGHIRLSREHDLVVVVPASANIMAKMVAGLADDLASTLLLATNKPVVMAPAMNVCMWNNNATQRNVAQLKEDGIKFIGPEVGDLACGEEGEGRMSDSEAIVSEIMSSLHEGNNIKNKECDSNLTSSLPLAGRRAIVTSGPTQEMLDPVRYISNFSSGKQGYAIASSLAKLGADVTLISGSVNLDPPENVKLVQVVTAQEMLEACLHEVGRESEINKELASGNVDIAICAAAVADWSPKNFSGNKIKKSSDSSSISILFKENVDVLQSLSEADISRPKLVIGFAAETQNICENAVLKLKRKGCDWIVANDVSGGNVFNSDYNTVHVFDKNGQESWPEMTKADVANRLAQRVVGYFSSNENKILGGCLEDDAKKGTNISKAN